MWLDLNEKRIKEVDYNLKLAVSNFALMIDIEPTKYMEIEKPKRCAE